MAKQSRHEEWRDQNLDRRFPFQDHTTLRSDTGLILPNSLMVDAVLYMLAGQGPYFLRRVTNSPLTLSVAIAGRTNAELATGSIDHADPGSILTLTDTYGRPAGLLVLGNGRSIVQSWPNGDHLFTAVTAGLTATVQMDFSRQGLAGVLAESTAHSGDVWLVGENGVQLWHQDGFIRVDIVGNPLRGLEDCAAADPDAATTLARRIPLKTINLIPADDLGDFQLFAGGQLALEQVLRTNPIVNGLKIAGVV